LIGRSEEDAEMKFNAVLREKNKHRGQVIDWQNLNADTPTEFKNAGSSTPQSPSIVRVSFGPDNRFNYSASGHCWRSR